MKYRKHRQYLSRHGHWLLPLSTFLLASVASLWSWNVLAELFAWPEAQYRHALAALLILFVAGRALFPARRQTARPAGARDEPSTH